MSVIDQFIDELTQAIGGLDKRASEGKGLLKSIVSSQVRKLDLVTREEFDAQAALLAATEAKLKSLEQVVSDLENDLADRS